MAQIRNLKLNNFSCQKEAQTILDALQKGEKSIFISEAIILKHKVDSGLRKQFKS